MAGVVWSTLSENGTMTMAKLVKAVGEPRDTVMQALGWLAREDKSTLRKTAAAAWYRSAERSGCERVG